MTARSAITLHCDGHERDGYECDQSIVPPSSGGARVDLARQTAADLGWTTRPRGPRTLDFCPTHSTTTTTARAPRDTGVSAVSGADHGHTTGERA